MQEKASKTPVLAMDLGGTKIATALVSAEGRVLDQRITATLAEEGPEAVIRRMVTAVNSILAEAHVDRPAFSTIALASAGIIDVPKGIVTASPSLPGWHDIPVQRRMEEETGLRCFLTNDATAAVVAEHRLGAGRGFHNLIYMTISTGIGGGILVDGNLYTGSSGCAGEVGHMIIDADGPPCNCGGTGCLEALASGLAVAKEARRRIARGTKSILIELAEGESQNISAKTVATAAQRGDPLALEVVSRVATYLGIGMANLVNIFNPDRIILGGGMSKMGDLLLDPVRRTVAERAFKLPVRAAEIVPCELGDEVGVVGAALCLLMSKGPDPLHGA
jgi:glucokinase